MICTIKKNAALCLCADTYDAMFEKTLATLPLVACINRIHLQKINQMKMNPGFKELDLHAEVFDKWYAGVWQMMCRRLTNYVQLFDEWSEVLLT